MIQNVGVGAFDNCEDPTVPEAQTEPARDSQGRELKPDPDFNTNFGYEDSLPPPTPEASQSTWNDWIAPVLTAPSKAASHVKSFFGPASP